MVLTAKELKPYRSVYYKDIAGAATVDEATDKIYGYLAAFGNKDDSRDILIKGCFAKSIQERGPQSSTPRKIAFLHAHKQDVAVGKFTKLEEQDKGLYYEADLSKDPFTQSTIKVQLKEGILNNHSVGYNYIWDKTEYDEASDSFICKELDTFEGSILTLGMNENTPFGGFKKFFDNTDQVKELHLSAEKALRGFKNFNKEYELRKVIKNYQSLLDLAAEEITAMKKKPNKFDYKYLADNLIK